MRFDRLPTAVWVALLFVGTPNPGTAAPVPDAALRGTVVSTDGSAAAGASVWATRQTYGLPDRREATADAAGRFEIGGLARGFHMAVAGGPGRERQRVLFDTTARADAELDIPVPVGGTVAGRVTDAAGQPLRGAFVGKHITGFEPCGV